MSDMSENEDIWSQLIHGCLPCEACAENEEIQAKLHKAEVDKLSREKEELSAQLERAREALTRCADYAKLNLNYEELAHSENIIRVVEEALKEKESR